MDHPRLRRCSLVVMGLQAACLAVIVAAHFVETYVGVLGALVQLLLAAVSGGVGIGCWLFARPRGAAALWVAAMPVSAIVCAGAALLVLSSFRWGC